MFGGNKKRSTAGYGEIQQARRVLGHKRLLKAVLENESGRDESWDIEDTATMRLIRVPADRKVAGGR